MIQNTSVRWNMRVSTWATCLLFVTFSCGAVPTPQTSTSQSVQDRYYILALQQAPKATNHFDFMVCAHNGNTIEYCQPAFRDDNGAGVRFIGFHPEDLQNLDIGEIRRNGFTKGALTIAGAGVVLVGASLLTGGLLPATLASKTVGAVALSEAAVGTGLGSILVGVAGMIGVHIPGSEERNLSDAWQHLFDDNPEARATVKRIPNMLRILGIYLRKNQLAPDIVSHCLPMRDRQACKPLHEKWDTGFFHYRRPV